MKKVYKHNRYSVGFEVKDNKVFLPKDRRRKPWIRIKRMQLLSKLKKEKGLFYYWWSDFMRGIFKSAYRTQMKQVRAIFKNAF